MGSGTLALIAAYTMTCSGYADFRGQLWAGGSEGWRPYASSHKPDQRTFFIDPDRATWCSGLAPCRGFAQSFAGKDGARYWILTDSPADADGRSYQLAVTQDGYSYREITQVKNSRDRTELLATGNCTRREYVEPKPLAARSPVAGGKAPLHQGDRNRWFSMDMLAPELRDRLGAGGTIHYLLTISPEGRASGCKHDGKGAVAAELGDALCQKLIARSRFSPATDAAGKPTSGEWSGAIRYRGN